MCQSASIWGPNRSFIAYLEKKVIFYTVFCATGWPVHLGSPRTFLVLALEDPYSEDPLSYLMAQNHLSYSLFQNRAEASPLLWWPLRELEERHTVEILRGKATPPYQCHIQSWVFMSSLARAQGILGLVLSLLSSHPQPSVCQAVTTTSWTQNHHLSNSSLCPVSSLSWGASPLWIKWGFCQDIFPC